MLCMYTLYFKRCTLYKFIEINSVLLTQTDYSKSRSFIQRPLDIKTSPLLKPPIDRSQTAQLTVSWFH